jgi:hypothetical protein
MTELNDNALLEISEQDLAAVLTEAFCGSYTPFKLMRVVAVYQNDGSDVFTLRLSPEITEQQA